MSDDKKKPVSSADAAVLVFMALLFSGALSPRTLERVLDPKKIDEGVRAHADKVRKHAREDELASAARTQGVVAGIAFSAAIAIAVVLVLMAAGVISF